MGREWLVRVVEGCWWGLRSLDFAPIPALRRDRDYARDDHVLFAVVPLLWGTRAFTL